MLSFIVPAYNEELELPATLAAIRTAAEPAGRAYEIIVVDDDSTDATAELARAAGAHVVSVRHRQIAAARNAGARIARGDVLFFIDADTRISAVHITRSLEALAAGYSGGSARIKMDGVVPFWARVFLALFSAVYFTAKLGAGAFLFTRREFFDAAGGFNEEYFAAEETYLSISLKKFGRFVVVREPVLTSGRKVRMHSTGQLLRLSFAILLGGKRVLRDRRRLDLWYDGKRERPA